MRPRTRSAAILAFAVLLVIVTTVLAPVASAAREASFARMNGAKEIPGPGDPDGRGRAKIAVFPARERLCFAIKVARIILPAAAAHVHEGPKDVAGPVVVTLIPPDSEGVSAGCVEVTDTRLLRRIRRDPGAFYVNVHTSDFADGAVRGQLRPFPE